MAKLFKKRYLIFVFIFLVVLVMWFSWMTIESLRTTKMEDRVKGLLNTGLQIAAIETPRVKVENNGGFYGPDLNNSHAISEVYSKVYSAILEGLQDSTTPFCKVESFRMDTDYISELHAYANVKFEVLPGLTKTIAVTTSIKAPQYKEMTGLDEIVR